MNFFVYIWNVSEKKSDLKGHVDLSSISLICTNGKMLEFAILLKIFIASFLMCFNSDLYILSKFNHLKIARSSRIICKGFFY